MFGRPKATTATITPPANAVAQGRIDADDADQSPKHPQVVADADRLKPLIDQALQLMRSGRIGNSKAIKSGDARLSVQASFTFLMVNLGSSYRYIGGLERRLQSIYEPMGYEVTGNWHNQAPSEHGEGQTIITIRPR